MSHLGIVVNPTAGHGRGADRGTVLADALRRRGHEVRDLSGPTLVAATAHARRAAVEGMDALVVVGGDGMVHLGANVVADTTLPLAIVAAGSGNDIARGLGLPRHDVEGAVRAIEDGLSAGPRWVDAVRVSPLGHSAGEWCLGVVSAGIDAAINAHANTYRWPRGHLRYVRAFGPALRRFRPWGYRLTFDDGRAWESLGTLVAVANGPLIGGGFAIAPDARFDDGLLDVVVAGPVRWGDVVRYFPRLYRGGHLAHPAVQVFRARSLTIEHSPLGPVPPDAFADGERLGPVPLHVEVHPRAVGVLA